MDIITNNRFIVILNNICRRFLMPAVAISFVCYNTVIDLWTGGRAETFQNLLAMLILGVFACNVIADIKNFLPYWIKQNYLVLLYMVVRIISLIESGFDYSVIRSIFFEIFILVGVCNITVADADAKNGQLYIKIFVYIELALAMASLILFYTMPLWSESIQEVIINHTFFERCGNAMLFGNPNTAGLMAGFAIVVAILCYRKGYFNDRFLFCFGLFNVIALLLFGCRSSDVGVIVVLVAMIFAKAFPGIKKRTIVIVSLTLVLSTLIPIYFFIGTEGRNDSIELDEAENIINTISTGRYIIWKQSYMAQQDDFILGDGSLKKEMDERKELVQSLDEEYYWRFVAAAQLGPHNGYIGMISATGILGLGLFVAILFQRMSRSSNLKKGNWYLALVFVFIVNCFESLFILNRFFICFYMMLILEIEFDSEK